MEYLFIIIFLLFPVIFWFTLNNKSRPRRPPGPRGLPLIGNLHQLGKNPYETFWELSKKYGPLLYLKLGSRKTVVVNSSKLAEEILKNQDLAFCSRAPFLASQKLTYGGMDMAFSPYSEQWREMRKVCMVHLLSAGRVKSFRPIRERETSVMTDKISGHALRSETVNLTEIITFMTSTIISRIAFGKIYEQGSGERRQFNEIIREFQTALAGTFYFTDYFPWLAWMDTITGKLDRLDKVFRKWDAFYERLIDEHRQPDRPVSMDGGVVDIMLKLKDEKSTPFDLTIDRIKAVLADVYFASTDTIATTIIWAMTLMIKNPTVLKKVQTELRSIGKKQTIIDEEDLLAAEFPYFRAFIRESLRMFPTIPGLVPRETETKCTIDGYEIPAKTTIQVNSFGLGKDPKLWENPGEFLPERFLGSEQKYRLDLNVKEFGFIPFGAGRRGCPGASMAVATVEIGLANLVYHFDWKLPAGTKIDDIDSDITPGLTLHKTNPLMAVPVKA